MRNLVVLFWAFILGQVVAYIGGALSGGTYDFTTSTILSLVIGLLIILLGYASAPTKTKKN